MASASDTKTTRPTPCNKKIYINFSIKCRRNRRKIMDVQNDLYDLYVKKGESLFQLG